MTPESLQSQVLQFVSRVAPFLTLNSTRYCFVTYEKDRSNRYSAARLTPLWPCQSAACSLYGRPLNIPTQTKCACSVSSLERDSELVCRVRYYSGEELNKDSSKELGRCAEFPTLADASSTARAALLYMTVWGNKRELLGAELLGISGHLPTYSSLQKRTA